METMTDTDRVLEELRFLHGRMVAFERGVGSIEAQFTEYMEMRKRQWRATIAGVANEIIVFAVGAISGAIALLYMQTS
jgi:hypothetical protein